MRPERGPERPGLVPLGIAGLPTDEADKKYIRQASLLLRFRIWTDDARRSPRAPVP